MGLEWRVGGIQLEGGASAHSTCQNEGKGSLISAARKLAPSPLLNAPNLF